MFQPEHEEQAQRKAEKMRLASVEFDAQEEAAAFSEDENAMDNTIAPKLMMKKRVCKPRTKTREEQIATKRADPHFIKCSVEECWVRAKIKASSGILFCKKHATITCVFSDCNRLGVKYVDSDGFAPGIRCSRHGGRRCTVRGCTRIAGRSVYIADQFGKPGRRCTNHGGSVMCKFKHCTQMSRSGPFCHHHTPGIRCSVANCLRTSDKKTTVEDKYGPPGRRCSLHCDFKCAVEGCDRVGHRKLDCKDHLGFVLRCWKHSDFCTVPGCHRGAAGKFRGHDKFGGQGRRCSLHGGGRCDVKDCGSKGRCLRPSDQFGEKGLRCKRHGASDKNFCNVRFCANVGVVKVKKTDVYGRLGVRCKQHCGFGYQHVKSENPEDLVDYENILPLDALLDEEKEKKDIDRLRRMQYKRNKRLSVVANGVHVVPPARGDANARRRQANAQRKKVGNGGKTESARATKDKKPTANAKAVKGKGTAKGKVVSGKKPTVTAKAVKGKGTAKGKVLRTARARNMRGKNTTLMAKAMRGKNTTLMAKAMKGKKATLPAKAVNKKRTSIVKVMKGKRTLRTRIITRKRISTMKLVKGRDRSMVKMELNEEEPSRVKVINKKKISRPGFLKRLKTSKRKDIAKGKSGAKGRSIAKKKKNIAKGKDGSKGKNIAKGKKNIAKGKKNIAKGKNNIAKGKNNIAKGKKNIAKGNENTANGKGMNKKKTLKTTSKRRAAARLRVKKELHTPRAMAEKENTAAIMQAFPNIPKSMIRTEGKVRHPRVKKELESPKAKPSRKQKVIITMSDKKGGCRVVRRRKASDSRGSSTSIAKPADAKRTRCRTTKRAIPVQPKEKLQKKGGQRVVLSFSLGRKK